VEISTEIRDNPVILKITVAKFDINPFDFSLFIVNSGLIFAGYCVDLLFSGFIQNSILHLHRAVGETFLMNFSYFKSVRFSK